MNIARILYPVEVLGPGKRIGIWMRGCSHKCEGCSNPELWDKEPECELSSEEVRGLINTIVTEKAVDGFTVTGGDPFYDQAGLLDLLKILREISQDIIVYTGYTHVDLISKKDPVVDSCLELIGVLIDGKYVEKLNKGALLRGSSNQNIIILNRTLQEKYEKYLEITTRNYIQNFQTTNAIISVGIHNPGFDTEIIQAASKRGVIIHGES